jgi:hypothetical protein
LSLHLAYANSKRSDLLQASFEEKKSSLNIVNPKITNYLTNALKYSPSDQSVEVRREIALFIEERE